MTEQLADLKKLREPFPAGQIGKLPKGGIFLDFVGHGFITGRLLDVDPLWDWEPFSTNEDGLPSLDEFGGLWIRLTVCGKTRIGYGDAGGKKGPNAIKEAIGDALRNAGMRFGIALELWARGDLDAPPDEPPRQRTDLDDALDELGDYCAAMDLNQTDVAAKFYAIHKKPPRHTSATAVREFIETLHDKEGAA
jgi:hypothetical protein